MAFRIWPLLTRPIRLERRGGETWAILASCGYVFALVFTEAGAAAAYFAHNNELRLEPGKAFFIRHGGKMEIYHLEITGNQKEPKSIENDFFITVAGQREKLSSFVRRRFPLKAGQYASEYIVERNGYISLVVGEAPIVTRRFSLKTTAMLSDGTIKQMGCGLPAAFPSSPTIGYHFHPTGDPAVLSPVDVDGMKAYCKISGQPPLPELVINSHGKGNLYVPKSMTNWQTAFAVLNEAGTGNEDFQSSKRWLTTLKEYFEVVKFEVD